MTYMNPYFDVNGKQFAEGDKLGYFIKNSNNESYISSNFSFFLLIVDIVRIWEYQKQNSVN